MWLVELVIVFLVPLGLCLLGANYHYGKEEQARSRLAGAGVLVFYALHASFTGIAAWRGIWPVALDGPIVVGVGIAMIAAGVALFLAAVVAFRSLERMSGVRNDHLITSGVYRFSRNPQNTGWGLMLLGMALAGRSGLAFALALPFWVFLHIYLLWIEEPYLRGVFGDSYRQYCATTPRYLGLPRGRDKD
jgi:protein-S-isoprenylcysteine O-methyltransferase Ste14